MRINRQTKFLSYVLQDIIPYWVHCPKRKAKCLLCSHDAHLLDHFCTRSLRVP